MSERIERTRNTNDEATLSDAITLNDATSVKIADADSRRIFFHICLEDGTTDKAVFIKLQAAIVDDDKKGICIIRRMSGNDNLLIMDWTMPTDNIYTGEISAISVDGPINIYVTKY